MQNLEISTESLTFYTNKQTISVSTTTEGISGSLSEKAGGQHTLTFTGVTTSMTQIVIVFTGSGSSNVRLDNIVLKGTKAGGGSQDGTYTLTYNANGATSGTVPVDENEYDADNNTVTVLGNTGNLEKSGYTYTGWNTKADGTGTDYTAGATFTISANTTLYAKWEANIHNVTLPVENEFGSYTMDATNPVAVDTEVTLTYTPATGYENYQATWSVNGTALAGNTFTMPDEDVTITVSVNEVLDYATLPFSWEGGTSAALLATQGVTASGLGSDYAEGNAPYRVKLDNTGDYIQIKTDSQPGKVTIGVKMLGGGTASSIKVQGSSDGETFTDVETLSISGSQNDVLTLATKNSFAETDRYVRLLFTKGSNVGVGPITIAIPSTAPEIVADETVSLSAEATSGEIAYTIVNPISGTDLSATSDANWISNIAVGEEKVTFTTSENTGDERSAIITLTYGTLAKDVTVTQAKPVVTLNYTLATAVVPGKHYIIVGLNNNEYKAMGEQKDNNRGAVEITVNNNTASVADNAGIYEVRIDVDNATGHYVLFDEAYKLNGGYLYAAQGGTSSGNYMKTEEALDSQGNGVWNIEIDATTGVATIKATNPNITRNTLRYNYSSGSSLFSCYSSGQKDVYLFERDNDESPVQTTITVSPATDKTYTTFCRAIDLDFTNVSGIEAYVVSGLTESSASIKKVNKVPAGEGIILKRTGTDESFDIPFAEPVDAIAKNYMVGVTKETNMDDIENAYILSGGLFYECSGGKLAAGKAYLNDEDEVWATAVGAPSFSIIVDGETTGIENVKGEGITNSQYYTLDGRRVAEPTKGIYIVNGRKVVVK